LNPIHLTHYQYKHYQLSEYPFEISNQSRVTSPQDQSIPIPPHHFHIHPNLSPILLLIFKIYSKQKYTPSNHLGPSITLHTKEKKGGGKTTQLKRKGFLFILNSRKKKQKLQKKVEDLNPSTIFQSTSPSSLELLALANPLSPLDLDIRERRKLM